MLQTRVEHACTRNIESDIKIPFLNLRSHSDKFSQQYSREDTYSQSDHKYPLLLQTLRVMLT